MKIRLCRDDETDTMLAIINAAAEAYRGVIPPDCWHEPYMPAEELRSEVEAGIAFVGCEIDGELAGVMGIQPVRNVDLIRHAYVLPAYQGQGVGTALIAHLRERSERQILVGTWTAARWAIGFYERHGFRLVPEDAKATLLRTYWTVSERQIETSVVLAAPDLDDEGATTGTARVRAWLDVREPLERQLEPLGQAAFAQLQLRSGERVLDIGFGIGTTPFALAQAVAPSGEVVGIDVLQAALDVMRADARWSPNVSFIHGDAEVYPFAPSSFDAAFSRFGVMFFSDPVAAFANIRHALRSGGRLAFTCWRRLAENELDELPIRAASSYLPAQLVAEAETAVHFSFADPAFLKEVLTRAGYVGIDIREHDEQVRSDDLQAMVDVCSRVGSLGAILREHPEFRGDVVPALKQALATLDGPGGPALRAATWNVLAFAPS